LTSSSEPRDRSTQAAPAAQTRRLRWWIAGITLVVGFVFGVLAVGLLSAGTPDFGTQAGPGPGTTPTTLVPTPGGTLPAVAEARVNAACLAVINEAQDMYTVLTGLGQAVKDVDLQQLDDIVRRLQPIEARLGQDLQKCEVETDVVTNPTGSAPPEPITPQPSPSATR
jgi:hypothetical protein